MPPRLEINRWTGAGASGKGKVMDVCCYGKDSEWLLLRRIQIKEVTNQSSNVLGSDGNDGIEMVPVDEVKENISWVGSWKGSQRGYHVVAVRECGEHLSHRLIQTMNINAGGHRNGDVVRVTHAAEPVASDHRRLPGVDAPDQSGIRDDIPCVLRNGRFSPFQILRTKLHAGRPAGVEASGASGETLNVRYHRRRYVIPALSNVDIVTVDFP